MRDLIEYLRAYQAYVSANIGWGKAVLVMLVWLAGIFAPLGIRTFVLDLPDWLAIGWMAAWSALGYIFAPYGMWKHYRGQVARATQPE
jgi:hypothetical protein